MILDQGAEGGDRQKSLGEYLALLRRRKVPLLSCALLILTASLALAAGLPAIFESTATILVEQQEIPKDLVASTVTGYADQRLQVISQRVMTSANLLGIVKRYNLYEEELARQPPEVVIEMTRNSIRMEPVSADVRDPTSGRPGKATIAFTIAFEHERPDVAQKVANELVSLYLNENIKTRTAVAKEASTFLATEAERLKTGVADLEAKLAEFKEKNAGKLPELQSLNMELMDRADRELLEVDRRISSLEERRIYLQSQLAQISPVTRVYSESGERILGPKDRLKVLEAEYLTLSAKYSPTHPDVLSAKKQIEALQHETGGTSAQREIETRLNGKRGELAELRTKYSAEHPDVKGLERDIASLESDLARTPVVRAPVSQEPPDNPAYIQLQADLAAANTEMVAMNLRRRKLEERLADFEQRLLGAPQVEREYRALLHDHETSVAKYQEISTKQMAAQVSQSLESEQKGERFTLIEPPQLPVNPSRPNRTLIVLLGALLAFGSGVGAAAIAESIDSTIRGRAGIIAIVGVSPLAVIPYVATAAEVRGHALGQALAAAGVILTLLLALMAVHVFIEPLDVLWFIVLRKLGLA